MSIRMTARFNNQPLDDLIGFMESYQQIANQEMDNALKVIEPLALAELQTEPGKPNYPIEWQSEKQRKAFWASNGFGRGIGAERTHTLSNSWSVEKNSFGQDIVVRFGNSAPYAKFVEGSLSKSNPGRFMQKMHRNTGWQQASDTVDFWMEALVEQFIDNMKARLGELAGGTTIKTRAYTGKTIR